MQRRNSERRVSSSSIGVLALAAALATPAHADDATPAALPASSQSAAEAALGAPPGPNPETGLPLGGFLVYPRIFAGVIYNDNVYPLDGRKAALGIAFAPNVAAIDDEGLHKTTLTLNADAELYPSQTRSSSSGQSPTNVSGVASIEHVWKPTEDLTVDVTAGFTRQYGVFGSLLAAGSKFVSTASPGSVTSYPQFSNQVSGSISVEKKITEQWFLRGGFGAQDIEYESVPAGVGGGLSGADYNAFLRSGFWVTPQVNAFVEGGADLRRYTDSWYDSNAYRVVGGLSSDLISLFRGEVYAGYQKQFSVGGTFGAVSAPAYGAKIYYYPTRYLTMAASVDQSFGSAATPTTPKATRSPSGDTVQSRFQADYSLAEYWTASFAAGYARTTWSNSPLVQSEWTVGGGVSYEFWRNIALTLNYQYTATAANEADVAVYNQNIVSAGMTYHY
jgi:hypothetical protein